MPYFYIITKDQHIQSEGFATINGQVHTNKFIEVLYLLADITQMPYPIIKNGNNYDIDHEDYKNYSVYCIPIPFKGKGLQFTISAFMSKLGHLAQYTKLVAMSNSDEVDNVESVVCSEADYIVPSFNKNNLIQQCINQGYFAF